jgi:hypothetical protein
LHHICGTLQADPALHCDPRHAFALHACARSEQPPAHSALSQSVVAVGCFTAQHKPKKRGATFAMDRTGPSATPSHCWQLQQASGCCSRHQQPPARSWKHGAMTMSAMHTCTRACMLSMRAMQCSSQQCAALQMHAPTPAEHTQGILMQHEG